MRLVKLSTFWVVCLISLFIVTPVLAVPVLPSSFYGTVKVKNENVPDGVLIQALIDGKVYAEGLTQTYQGNSVYSLDITGDDTTTDAREGGRDGDTVQFTIAGAQAKQTGTWHSGTNAELNLTVENTTSVIITQTRAAVIPTQTAIVKKSSKKTSTPVPAEIVPTTIVLPSPMPTQVVFTPTQSPTIQEQPSPIPTQPSVALVQSSPAPTSAQQPTAGQAQPSTTATEPAGSDNGGLPIATIIAGAIIAVVIAGFGLFFLKLKSGKG